MTSQSGPPILVRICLGAAFGSLTLLAITPLRDYSPVQLTLVHYLVGAVVFGAYLGAWTVGSGGALARRLMAVTGVPVAVAFAVTCLGAYYMLWRVGLADVYDIAYAWFERILVGSALAGLVTVGSGFSVGALLAFYRNE